ncbi:MAG: hypothetical protein IT371_15820 [Deltaproteobacteria bacterium]|nr:hypothetical protein [Deltaproteobacteria bacterium]
MQHAIATHDRTSNSRHQGSGLRTSLRVLGAACATALALSGCKDSSTTTPPATTSTTYSGLWAGPAAESGELELAVQNEPGKTDQTGHGTVSGTLRLSTVAGTITLSGSVTFGAGSVTFSGSASGALGSFSCTGTLAAGVLRGSCTGADGKARPFELRNASSAAPTRYCGTFAGGLSGTWNLVVGSDGNAGAIFYSSGLAGGAAGKLTGTALAMDLLPPVKGTASGTVENGAVNGTWKAETFGEGSFSGSTRACPSQGTATGDGGGPKIDGGTPQLDGAGPKVDGAGPKVDGAGPKVDQGTATGPVSLYKPKSDGTEPTCGYSPVVTPGGVFCGSTIPAKGVVIKVPLTGGKPTVVAPAINSQYALPFYLARSSTLLAFSINDVGYDPADSFPMYSLPLATTGGDTPKLILANAAPSAVNDTHLYFRRNLDGWTYLYRVGWQGGTPEALVSKSPRSIGGKMALDGAYVYYGAMSNDLTKVTFSGIVRLPLAGGTPETGLYKDANGNEWLGYSLEAVIADATHLYLAPGDESNGKPDTAIYKVAKGGGTVTELVKTTGPRWLADDATHIYYSSRYGSQSRAMGGFYRVAKTGGTPEKIAAAANGVAVDATHVYWISNGELFRQSKASIGSAPLP